MVNTYNTIPQYKNTTISEGKSGILPKLIDWYKKNTNLPGSKRESPQDRAVTLSAINAIPIGKISNLLGTASKYIPLSKNISSLIEKVPLSKNISKPIQPSLISTTIQKSTKPGVLSSIKNAWNNSKLLRRLGRTTGILGLISGAGYVRNKVLEADDLYNMEEKKEAEPSKFTTGVTNPGSKKDIDLPGLSIKSGKGRSTNTSTIPGGGSTNTDPYKDWKALDIEYSTRPEIYEGSDQPVMFYGTTKKITDIDKWKDFIKGFSEYTETPLMEGAKIDNKAIAKFYEKLKSMPKEEIDKYIEWYKNNYLDSNIPNIW